jgi:hypothetical protein
MTLQSKKTKKKCIIVACLDTAVQGEQALKAGSLRPPPSDSPAVIAIELKV